MSALLNGRTQANPLSATAHVRCPWCSPTVTSGSSCAQASTSWSVTIGPTVPGNGYHFGGEGGGQSTLSPAPSFGLSRRGFLQLVGASAGVTLISLACAPAVPSAQSTPGSAGSSRGQVTLPTYVAFQGPPPDVPGSADGLVPPGYLKYPLNPTK